MCIRDSEKIEATGAMSGDDLLRAMPQVGDMMFDNADTAANLNAARGDIGSINLRNLGTGNTLLLVNGRRMVSHPGTQTEDLVPRQTANINSIPLYGVERTEVLLGGASALYGSDAVSGVLNVVMDTRFEGLQLRAQYGGSEGIPLREGNVNVKFGQWFNEGRTRVTVLGGHTWRNEVRASEHELTANMDKRWAVVGTPFEGSVSFDDRLTTMAWGAFQTLNNAPVTRNGGRITTATGAFNIQPSANRCTSDIGNGLCIVSGTFSSTTDRELRFNAADQRSIFGGLDRSNLFSTIEHDLNDRFTLFGELNYYKANYKGMREAAAPLAAAPIVVPASNYWNPFGALYLPNGQLNPNRLPGINAPASGLALRITSFRPTDAARPYIVDDDAYRVLAGVRGDVWGMDWESALFYSRAQTMDTQYGSISNVLFSQALARSDPSAYNPFNGGDLGAWSGLDGSPNPADVIASITVPVRRRSAASLLQVDTRFVRNELFRLPAGNVGLAFGAEWRRETLSDDRDPRLDGTITYTSPVNGVLHSDVLGASPAGDTEGSRNVASVYAEFAVPVLKDLPLVRSLDLQLAGRWERYSDFGDVTTPKVALSWALFDGLMLRANWGKNFLAPNIIQINAEGSTVSNTRTDYYLCEADLRAGRITSFANCGRTYSVQAERSGNRDLQPERSESRSAGLVFQPKFLPDAAGRFSFTADYWEIDQTGVIGIVGEAVQLALDYIARVGGSSNPNVVRDAPDEARIALFAGTGLTPAGTPTLVYDRYVNRAPRTTRGLDFGLDWRLRTADAGIFTIGANASRLLERMQNPSPDEQAVVDAQAAGTINNGFRLGNFGDQLGINGTPEWRATLSTSWRRDAWLLGSFTRYVAGFDSTGAQLADGTLWHVPSWTTHDVFAERRFERPGSWLDNTRIRLTVRNATDRDPPLAPLTQGFYSGIHNIRGRGWYLTFTKRLYND